VAESGTVGPAPEARVSTGNAALDTMLEGGLMARRPYLVVGASGTGKSTLALQFLCEGVRRGERVLLVTLEEPPNECRLNHRGLAPEMDGVDVFDAIPDIMRYERVPFKDIASVRSAVAFKVIPPRIRRTPELTSVEVTITALEQMLRSEVAHKGYSRIVIDSLTALQYFCMKGFDPVAGAQTFLRFLSDLQVTTVLTVESPLEDVDTAERMLARGEIRLFRWELDGLTVRAIGVEKFRGSSHDVRLHPYRIGPKGLDINLKVTISRDTRQIVQPPIVEVPAAALTAVSPMVSLEEEVRDFVLIGAPLEELREALQTALDAAARGDRAAAERYLADADGLTKDLAESVRGSSGATVPIGPGAGEAYQRLRMRTEAARAGMPPTRLPEFAVLRAELERVLALIPPSVVPASVESTSEEPVVPVEEPSAELAEESPPEAAHPAPPAPENEEESSPAPAVVAPALASEEPTPVEETLPEPAVAIAPSLPLPPPPPDFPPPPPPPLRVAALPEPAGAPVAAPSPRVRLRDAPPPLPTLPNVPAAVPTPPEVVVPVASAAEPARSVAPAPPAEATATEPAASAATSAGRKKKRAPAPKRKAAPATPEPVSTTLVVHPPVGPPPSTSPTPAVASHAPEASAITPTKPKRRATRKRKAPTVVGATAGSMPTEDLGSPPPPSSSVSDAPEKEEPS
jgi:KaiC/GvpD/RAD55 family RecA-like ATPase